MILCRAPLRIPLGGGGSDFKDYYSRHGGHIVGFATNLYIYVVVKKTIDGKIHLKYSRNEVVDDPDKLRNRVAAECLKIFGRGQGLEIVTFSDVPEASGLGGSSAFCVALIDALHRFYGRPLDKESVFDLAYEIERVNAGVPGGIQDQYFAVYGGAHTLSLSEKSIDSIPLPLARLDKLLGKLSLVYTGEQRGNVSIVEEHKQRIEDADTSMISNLLEVKMLSRLVDDVIRIGAISEVAELFNEHWDVKISRDPSITNVAIDKIRRDFLEKYPGSGGKLIGSGGGGYLLFYSRYAREDGAIELGLDTEGVKCIYDSKID